MAYAPVHLGGFSETTATSITNDIGGSAATAGNMIVGWIFYNSNIAGGPLIVVDNNSVAQNVKLLGIPAGGTNYLAISYGIVTGAPTSWTATMGGGAAASLIGANFEEWSGFSAGATIDPGATPAVAAHIATSTAANSMSAGTLSTNVDGDFIWSFAIGDTGTATLTHGSAFTAEVVDNGSLIYSEFLTQTTHGTQGVFWQASATGSTYYLAGIALTQTTPPATGCAHTLPLMGVGCSIGWRAALVGGTAARLGQAIEENGIITRRAALGISRRSLLGHNGGPPLDDWK